MASRSMLLFLSGHVCSVKILCLEMLNSFIPLQKSTLKRCCIIFENTYWVFLQCHDFDNSVSIYSLRIYLVMNASFLLIPPDHSWASPLQDTDNNNRLCMYVFMLTCMPIYTGVCKLQFKLRSQINFGCKYLQSVTYIIVTSTVGCIFRIPTTYSCSHTILQWNTFI